MLMHFCLALVVRRVFLVRLHFVRGRCSGNGTQVLACVGAGWQVVGATAKLVSKDIYGPWLSSKALQRLRFT